MFRLCFGGYPNAGVRTRAPSDLNFQVVLSCDKRSRTKSLEQVPQKRGISRFFHEEIGCAGFFSSKAQLSLGAAAHKVSSSFQFVSENSPRRLEMMITRWFPNYDRVST